MADKNDFSELMAEMLLRMDRQEAQTEKTNTILTTVVDVQSRMLTQMETVYADQQRFNRRTEAHFERVDGFMQQQRVHYERADGFMQQQQEVNQSILQELKTIKTDVRELKEVVLHNHEERLRRLEDFMRRAS